METMLKFMFVQMTESHPKTIKKYYALIARQSKIEGCLGLKYLKIAFLKVETEGSYHI